MKWDSIRDRERERISIFCQIPKSAVQNILKEFCILFFAAVLLGGLLPPGRLFAYDRSDQEIQPKGVSRTDTLILFDGKSLGKWKVTPFKNHGSVTVKNGEICLGMGYMTGVTWSGPLLRTNYEICLEAMRVEGEDFFCGLTFPVGPDPCSLIVGGWGGETVGLSSIDYFDASENATTIQRTFESNRWYRIRLRVTETKIEAWIDGDRIVDLVTTGHSIGIRSEVKLSQPLGIATYWTSAAIRHIIVYPTARET